MYKNPVTLCAIHHRQNPIKSSRYEVYTTVKIHSAIFWVMTLCILVVECQHLGRISSVSCTPKTEAVYASETLVPTYQYIRYHNQELYNINYILVMIGHIISFSENKTKLYQSKSKVHTQGVDVCVCVYSAFVLSCV
jgi:hypothetical protein